MRLLLRASIAGALLLVVAGCGITGDEVAKGPSSTRSSTTTTTEADETSTTTEPESTTTEGDGGRIDDDPVLADLLLTGDDFGSGLTADPESDAGFEKEFCEGHDVSTLPSRQASVGYTTEDQGTFVAEAIAEFDDEDAASASLDELASLNDVCKTTDSDNAIPGTFESIDGLGDEAIRAVPDASAVDPFEVIVARTGARIVLLASFGDQQLLSNAVIAEAVDRASS